MEATRSRTADDRGAVLRRLQALIDRAVSRQVNAILHHPAFQKLEASWRGLRYLVDAGGGSPAARVRVLDLSIRDLKKDVRESLEPEGSELFRKVYHELDVPGGEPFGLLLGDYEMRHGPSADSTIEDLEVLDMVSKVAATAFAPFIAAASPALLGLESASGFDRPLDLRKVFAQDEYRRWRKLRESEDARWVGLVFPRILLRTPYRDDPARGDGFRFEEEAAGPRKGEDDAPETSGGLLWGNGAYAFGAVAMRAFLESGWLSDLRGVERDRESGGLVTGLPAFIGGPAGSRAVPGMGQGMGEDAFPLAPLEYQLPDQLERDLSEQGILALTACKDTPWCAFFSCPSVQAVRVDRDPMADVNRRISAMLHYLLCVSRFAHHLKAIGRDKVGSVGGAAELQDLLNEWLSQFILRDDHASTETKARFPLRDSRVSVEEGLPGEYACVMMIAPHYQLEAVSASLKLSTRIKEEETRENR